jgi:cyclic beta-1,2-glucan synthetase
LVLRNLGKKRRRISAFFYVEWVLGTVREQAPERVLARTERDLIIARNIFEAGRGPEIAFAGVNGAARALATDRTAFLGRNGSPSSPVALEKLNLPKSPNDYPDPCAVVQTTLELAPSQEKEIIFFLGQAASSSAARETILRFSSPEECSSALKQVQDRWDALLGTIQVRTPNQALNLLLNRWLLYQVLSCRVWGRSALYQSSGAFGFRDQLQDSMALVYALPQEARAHIIRAAGRQFREGDVQHWWHPQTGAGVRTRIADDPLWLPYVTCNYIAKTGDACILDERIPFLEGPILRPEQDEDYRIPTISNETATLYEHCVRAIDCSLRFGAHGLPLMGTGDWNDGMNRVGSKGKGESVWLGWFLLATLRAFADLAKSRNESDRAATYAERAKRLGEAIETNAWDGRWYRRAYFDDGTPLGSANNVECRIDSIVQSWAVISGGAKEERAREAMAAVHELLVRPSEKVIALFTPPFSDGALDPGYIKGYVPGVRENGGQYTHAALWVVQATALLGIGNKAMGLIDLLNPILHSSSSEELTRYRVEPYVVPADVYSGEPHSGRGGWTWYTGSAGWFYRVALETILGFQLRGNKLAIISHIPSEWQQFAISYRYRSSVYVFSVNNPNALQTAVGRFRIDGQELPGTEFELRDDGHEHQVEVTLVAP